ncbi:ribonuclease inhibitor-like isoform X4 [Colossoma macropomum]|uniref:ribonuclease inhibitor-like isoform X4 n=1 Tax=Colossoma macropomum TaxID=42526 RepID=UPI0018655072|nr:ribonuclease inhibitor-like isoform X4 [Colossoma macropomum]
MMLLCVMLLIFSGFMESTSVNFKVVGRAESLVVDAGEDLILPCSLQPNISAVDMMVEWIRTDLSDNRLVHLYKDHKDTNDKQIKSYRGRTALFKTELQKGNTSLKLSGVQASDQGVYQCYIESGSLYDDITVHVEVKGKGFHAWKIAIICILMFAIVLTAFTAYILKDKFSKKQLSPAQCSFIAYMRVQSENMKEDLDLKKFNTSEEGYRRLIPAITNCRKARFAGCNLTALSFETLSTALQTENSSVKELDLSNNDLQDAGVEKLSAGLKSSHCKLEIIRLTVCKLSTQSCYTLQSVLQTETSCLKELDLSNNDLYDSGVEELSAGLKSSHCKLEKLRLAVCKLSAESCNTLQSVLQTETSCLKELDLSNNDLQDAGVEKLSAGLKSSHCKLEIIRLAVCELSIHSCNTLQSVLQTETSCLKELDLSNNDLQDSGVEKLSAGLKSSHCKLEIIRLAACKLSAESCNTLQSVLQTETSCLKEIDLSNNDLQDSGVEKLSAALRSLHCKLEILRLAECKLSTQSCNSLHLVLQTQPYCLKELDLSNNDLYDSGVEKLSAGLKSTNCKLQILRLSGCIITEKGCFSLATALSSNPSHLKEVDLTYNHPEKSGVKLLSARREDPQCTLSTLRFL